MPNTKKNKKNPCEKKYTQLFSLEKKQEKIDRAILDLSSKLVSIKKLELEKTIEKGLGDIAKLTKADRVYIFEIKNNLMNNTYEWCINPNLAQKENLQGVETKLFPWWMKVLGSGGNVELPTLKHIPKKEKELKKILEMQDIKSLLVVPVFFHKELKGFLGLDYVNSFHNWNEQTIRLLRILASIISNTVERVKSEEKLEESKKNFENLFETITDFIFISSLEGHIIYANKTVKNKLGYKETELKGMHILDFHHKKNLKKAELFLKEMIEGKRDYCPIPLISKKGKIFPVETRIWLGKWNDKDVIYGISKDQTEQHAALEKFEKVFEENPSPMSLSTVDTKKFVQVNKAFCKLFGYKKEEIIGRTTKSLGIFINQKEHEKASHQLIKKGKIENVQLNIRTKNNNILSGLFFGSIIESQDRKLFLTSMIDVTNEKKSQEQLELSIEGSGLGLWDWWVLKGELSVSERWAEILGYKLKELQPINIKTWERLCHPDDFKKSQILLEDHFSGKNPYYECEIRMKHKSGNYVSVLDRGKVMLRDSKGKPLRMSGTHMDITERKKVEKQENEIKRLTEVNRLRDIFLTMTSHELRTPITPMKAELEMLLEEFFGKITKDQRKSLELILRNTKSLDSLIADIVDISRIQSDVLKLVVKKSDLKKVIKDSIDTMNPKAEFKGISLKSVVFEIPNLIIDPNRIRQVLINLINNAIKFTDKGGKIRVYASKKGKEVLVTVKDTGIGIKKEDFKRIFLPFEQVDSSLNRNYEGSGLGLAICSGIIGSHNGKIWVESKLEKGSMFKFTLPITKEILIKSKSK